MSTRPFLESSRIHPRAVAKLAERPKDVLEEVQRAIAQNDVVVIGMAQNPHVRKTRNALDAAGIPFTYLEYGSYLSAWQPRLTIKLWTGWPTFPQVFVKGVLLGGRELTEAAIADGTLKALLSQPRA